MPKPSGSRPAPDSARGSRGASRSGGGVAPTSQRYRRHPKPPYSYLALIALVIRAAPDQRLKLAQIIEELGSLFPFFGGGYQGWKDSVRHNLSCNPCFAKVLKDPAKPKAKGNYWTVDVDRIPPGALRLQNTAVARGGGPTFAHDLSPFVLQGFRYPPPIKPPPNPPPPPQTQQPPPPFSIESLLSDFPGGTVATSSPSPPGDPPIAPQLWGSSTSPIARLTPPIFAPPSPSCEPLGRSRTTHPPPLWGGQLPTSYSTAVAPNAVAPPPSGGTPLLVLRWGGHLLPSGPPRPAGIPPEAEAGGAQAMPPPNKSIFDVWLSHPGDTVPPALHG